MTRVITAEDILGQLDGLDPDGVNPTVGGGCVFTHPSTGNHCIAGQILANLGLPLPSLDSVLNGQAVSDLLDPTVCDLYEGVMFDKEALHLLFSAQRHADGPYSDSCLPSWGETVAYLRTLSWARG